MLSSSGSKGMSVWASGWLLVREPSGNKIWEGRARHREGTMGLGKGPEPGCQGACHPALHLPPLRGRGQGRSHGHQGVTWAVQNTTSPGPENAEHRRQVSLYPCGGWGLAQDKERHGGQGPASPLSPGTVPCPCLRAQEVTMMAAIH